MDGDRVPVASPRGVSTGSRSRRSASATSGNRIVDRRLLVVPLVALAAVVLAACIPVDPSSAARAADYSEANNGQVVLVHQFAAPVFSRSIAGWSTMRAHRLASGTKSFAGAMGIAAAQDGLLTLDEPASDTLTEWKSDSRKSRITIRQLLDQSSGLDPNRGWPGPDSYAAAIAAPTLAEPGARFDYGPNHFAAFAAIIDRKVRAAGVATDPLDYLQQRVFDPIGLDVAGWNTDAVGHHLFFAGAQLTADEWMKFGQLVAWGGLWFDSFDPPAARPILDPVLVDEMLKPSRANPAYGLGWWIDPTPDDQPNPDDPDIPGDIVFAAGAGNQHLYVSRSRGVVAVRFGEDVTFKDAQFLGLLFDRP